MDADCLTAQNGTEIGIAPLRGLLIDVLGNELHGQLQPWDGLAACLAVQVGIEIGVGCLGLPGQVLHLDLLIAWQLVFVLQLDASF